MCIFCVLALQTPPTKANRYGPSHSLVGGKSVCPSVSLLCDQWPLDGAQVACRLLGGEEVDMTECMNSKV